MAGLGDKLDITNETLQSDEIQALAAIFENEWVVEDSVNKVYSMTIQNSSRESLYLQIIFPANYPLEAPPIYLISAPWLNRNAKKRLEGELNEIYCQNLGENIVHLWIDKIRDFIEDTPQQFDRNEQISSPDPVPNILEVVSDNNNKFPECQLSSTESELPNIEHGNPITDRKSSFQAHVAQVNSVKQVQLVLQKLKENRKIAEATHNVVAYRITQGNIMNEDFDDDGESKAGSSLLHLLQLTDVRDVLVVVSRWYGGIHLGSDRFKHINNVAKSLLLQLGLIKKGNS